MSAAIPTFQRETFTLSRAMEFFTERELTAQIGFGKHLWPSALLKELLDNALDACEKADIAPVIRVSLFQDGLVVSDNGPGLPLAIIERSLDYAVRVSDKTGYISPSRGQQGNALKTLWAAPFVATGKSLITVTTDGGFWEISVHLDRIAGQPKINLFRRGDSRVKTGTTITLHWEAIASSLDRGDSLSFYMMLLGFHTLNPHLTLHIEKSYGQQHDQATWNAKAADWKRWSPREPTAPHWYEADHLRNLIALKIGNEQVSGEKKTVGQFIREFRGLSGTAKARDVAAIAGLQSALLGDLVQGGDLDMTAIKRLLTAMQAEARPVKPDLLGILGEAHCLDALAGYGAEGIQYRNAKDTHEGLPYVLEVAFGILPSHQNRILVIGVNFTYALQQPFTDLTRALSESQVQLHDPVILLLHLTTPRIHFTDRGKTRIDLPTAVAEKMVALVKSATKSFTAAKRRADRDDRMKSADADALRKANEKKFVSVKHAAWQLMEQAYLKASGNGKYPANARQIMYAARRQIIDLTGKTKPWTNDSYFTQKLLPAYIEAHPDQTAHWDVVYDVCGHLREPYTGAMVELGTLAVRSYIQSWRPTINASASFAGLRTDITTCGPANRYQFALFLEKEGFDELLKKARLAERFDIAVFSTKGMSVTAARQLVEALSEKGVTILVVRDFDLYGFRIAHTLCHDTRRYQFKTPPNVIDMGLRLQDAEAMGLDSEETEYDANPIADLTKYGATEDEIKFLAIAKYGYNGTGRRIELNEMDSETFVQWLESKLTEAKVKKVVPDKPAIRAAWQRQWETARLNQIIREAQSRIGDAPTPPPGIARTLEKAMQNNPGDSWDDILANLAATARRRRYLMARIVWHRVNNRRVPVRQVIWRCPVMRSKG